MQQLKFTKQWSIKFETAQLTRKQKLSQRKRSWPRPIKTCHIFFLVSKMSYTATAASWFLVGTIISNYCVSQVVINILAQYSIPAHFQTSCWCTIANNLSINFADTFGILESLVIIEYTDLIRTDMDALTWLNDSIL